MLAIIPARGGSKRLPNKNILPLGGKPLISWTIEAALLSNAVTRVIVSTDDPQIERVAKDFGADVPFIRASDLATDFTTTIDVTLDVLSRCESSKNIVLLQPTSPLRTARHIDAAVKLLNEKEGSAVISVCENEHPAAWINTLPQDGSMNQFIPDEIKNKRSQDLPKSYRINGAIYIANTECLIQERTFLLRNNSFAYIMDQSSSVDIDTKVDFALAEILMTNRIELSIE